MGKDRIPTIRDAVLNLQIAQPTKLVRRVLTTKNTTRWTIRFNKLIPAISMKIGIVMGSASDWPVMKGSAEILDEFGVEYDKKVLSAHRTPHELEAWVSGAREAGYAAIIAAAGGAAHLAGVCAAFTTLPVIGVPIKAKTLDGLDSLLSMVQMPSGIPVATVSIDGAKNAALLAVEIMAVTDKALEEKMAQFRCKQAEKVLSSELN